MSDYEGMSVLEIFEATEGVDGVCRTCGRAFDKDASVFETRGHITVPRVDGGLETYPQCDDCQNRQLDQTLEEWSENGDVGERNKSPLRQLVDTRQSAQKLRVALRNRECAALRGNDHADIAGLLEAKEHAKAIERVMDREIEHFLRDQADTNPIYILMQKAPYMGPILVARILSDYDVTKAGTVSAAWRFNGFAPGYDKAVKGQRRTFNRKARTAWMVWAMTIEMSKPGNGCKYRDFYEEQKARSYANPAHKDWKPNHHRFHALRLTAKLGISHFWETYRKLEGLPVRGPYVIATMGHDGYISPQEYGWPDVDEFIREREGHTDA